MKKERERRRRPERSGVRGIAALPREECQPPASTRYRLRFALTGSGAAAAYLPLGIAGIRGRRRYLRVCGAPPLLPGPPPSQAWRPFSPDLGPPTEAARLARSILRRTDPISL